MEYYAISVFYAGICFVLDCNIVGMKQYGEYTPLSSCNNCLNQLCCFNVVFFVVVFFVAFVCV